MTLQGSGEDPRNADHERAQELARESVYLQDHPRPGSEERLTQISNELREITRRLQGGHSPLIL